MISIHTSAREVTKVQEVIFDYLKISIHTSAREVTGSSSKPYQGCNHFNPHFRKGSDDIQRQKRGFQAAFQSTLPQGKWLTPSAPSKPVEKFQSTLPQGKWLLQVQCKTMLCDFNPHFRKGSDGSRGGYPADPDHFNPHFRKGSDPSTEHRPIAWSTFQSTLPQGKWPNNLMYGDTETVFQSTLPQGKWHGVTLWHTDDVGFQSTLPQGKWRLPAKVSFLNARFQSTLPQGKWLSPLIHLFPPIQISIHTSAREVTECQWPKHKLLQFQSTLPQGKWLLGDEVMYGLGISIHTSAREVTAACEKCSQWCKDFNPHFRKGSDLTPLVTALVPIVFQSTLPQGKWQICMHGRMEVSDFNPHFRKGSDPAYLDEGEWVLTFQSTLPQGKWRPA